MKPLPFSWIKQTTPSIIVAGFITVLVGFTSSIALILQAAQSLSLSEPMLSSWMWALGIGMGISSLGLSWWYKTPILTAWSTPGAAFLITALTGYSVSQAIGAFIISSALMFISGITGIFEKFIKRIPQSLGAGMLAGILLNVSIQVFHNIQIEWLMPFILLVVYMLAKRYHAQYTVLYVLCIGIVIAFLQGDINGQAIQLNMAQPLFTMPSFDIKAIISISLPLFIITMSSQNLPGVATLRTFGYHSPTSASVSTTGGIGLLLAPFGCFALNLAAITAAICMTKDVHPKKERRYIAGIWAGIFYIFIGIFGATVASIFTAFPTILITTLAAIALLPTLANSLSIALTDKNTREPALITFLTTASGISLWGIGTAFWAVVFGTIALLIVSVDKGKDTS